MISPLLFFIIMDVTNKEIVEGLTRVSRHADDGGYCMQMMAKGGEYEKQLTCDVC